MLIKNHSNDQFFFGHGFQYSMAITIYYREHSVKRKSELNVKKKKKHRRQKKTLMIALHLTMFRHNGTMFSFCILLSVNTVFWISIRCDDDEIVVD
ncbi:hypothetical protein DERF_010453 [Dermatophagoides farinae]|uniref:Transmembrane protein n=1 Tax=Dermatophagoides farinae TaxID=6954 RepID=A0A922HX27_DERFA|nr:hypothetical protein DERF_010453 [Dermatophagoides farinae]